MRKPAFERIIVGLGVFGHDTSIAILRGSKVLFAAEQERFDRLKHTRNLPLEALQAGLEHTGISPEEIDDVVTNFEPFRLVLNYFLHVWKYLPRSLRMLVDDKRYRNVLKMGRYKEALIERFDLNPGKVRWHHVPHHVAHVSSAFFGSSFSQAALLSSDALGEFDSILKGVGRETRIEVLERIPYPHSIGAVYSAVTEHLGFEMFSGEGKVMGLAAYGADGALNLLDELIHLEEGGCFSIDERFFSYHIMPWVHENWVNKRFSRRFGDPRGKEAPLQQSHSDLAKSLQDLAGRVLLHVCADLHERTGLTDLGYAGGAALNGYGNTRILRETGFKRLYIPPPANDGGTALGAGLFHAHHNLGLPRTEGELGGSLGPSFSTERCETALKRANLEFSRPTDLARQVAARLWNDRIVGFFRGRMEIGPRALGNRSILANPCNPGMKDRINLRVKHREPFRPFAPVVPLEAASRFFNMPCERSPYMLLIMDVRPEWRERLPAITHVDGTARVQTLERADNPLLNDVLREFEPLSGVPILLNTSFNDKTEPIVCAPEEAIRTFLSTGIDDLVLGDFLVKKTFPR